jgi:LDH2 family malate/lactate/ureidoglycolate dehydrogenase
VCVIPGASDDFSNAFCPLAIEVARARPRDDYDADVETPRAHVKSASPRASGGEIYFPGELKATAAERQRATGVQIEEHVWRQLAELADRLGTQLPSPAD